MKRVALVYDRVNKWGGAERVLLALHKIFPDAPLYASVYDEKKAPWAKVFDVRTSFLQKFPFAKSNHEFYAYLMPLAFESFSLDGYDLVVSVTSEAAKGIITKPGTVHICYCLTPIRYLWQSYDEYFKNPLLRFMARPIIAYLRTWDKIAAQRPDKFIAISKEVRKRIKKYYDRDSTIVYPPLQIPNPKSQIPNKLQDSKSKITNNYFLIVSRLVPYKRIDIVVKAFNKLKLPLKIIGTGSEKNKLRKIAKSNIEFLDNLTDKELVEYYKDCRALILPGIEDFGLTILEAQSLGKPVIAFGEGGSLETIIEDKTGIFFHPQTDNALIKTVNDFMKKRFNPKDCIEQARRFNIEMFKKRFEKEVKNSL